MNIEKLLNSNNISSIRATILAQLDSDRFRSPMIIKSKLESISRQPQLFESNTKVGSIREHENNWDSKYWTEMCVELSNNFSEEQLRHIVDVMSYLRKKGEPKFTPVKKIPPKQNRGRREEVEHHPGIVEKAYTTFFKKT